MNNAKDEELSLLGSSFALDYKEFRFLMCSFACTTFCTRILFFLVTFEVARLYPTEPLYLGYLGLVQAIPALGLALVGGLVADRFDRRNLLMGTLSIQIACAICLFLVSWSGDSGSLFWIYTIVFFLGVARGFAEPAVPSIEAQLVPARAVVSAATWSTLVWHSIAVIAPIVAGYVIHGAGVSMAYLVSVGFGVISVIALAGIRPRPVDRSGHQETICQSLSVGWKFVASRQILWTAMTLDLFAVLFGGAVALLPLFASQILHVDAVGLGYMNAAPYLGATVTALLCMRFPPRANAGQMLLCSVFGFGLSMIVFGLSTNFYLSCVALFASGMLDGLSVVIRKSLLRLYSPSHMRGRIAAVSSIFIGASNELGELESGVAAHYFGLARSVWLGGMLTLAIVVSVAGFAKELRQFDLRNSEDRHK